MDHKLWWITVEYILETYLRSFLSFGSWNFSWVLHKGDTGQNTNWSKKMLHVGDIEDIGYNRCSDLEIQVFDRCGVFTNESGAKSTRSNKKSSLSNKKTNRCYERSEKLSFRIFRISET